MVVVMITLADCFGRIGGFRALFILISLGLADCSLLVVLVVEVVFILDWVIARDKVDSVPAFFALSFSSFPPLSMLIRFINASFLKSRDLIESGFALVTLLAEAAEASL